MSVDESKREQWAKMQADSDSRRPSPQHEAHLKNGGSDGTLPPMEAVDAKIAAAEARTDTKFAELKGELSHFATNKTVWGATGTAIVAILGVLLATMAFGGDRFDAGMSTSPLLESVRADQRKLDAEQQRRDAEQDRKFDEILKRLPPPK